MLGGRGRERGEVLALAYGCSLHLKHEKRALSDIHAVNNCLTDRGALSLVGCTVFFSVRAPTALLLSMNENFPLCGFVFSPGSRVSGRPLKYLLLRCVTLYSLLVMGEIKQKFTIVT